MTRQHATTLDSARSAIARQKLEQRLADMRARGEGVVQRDEPFCLECGNALTPILCGYGCGRCKRVTVALESGARMVVR